MRRVDRLSVRASALYDAYAGLRRVGYTGPGAVDALVLLGVARDEAVAVDAQYQAAERGEGRTDR